MKTLIQFEMNSALASAFKGVKLKFVADGFEPEVAVVREGEKSNGEDLTLCIFLYYGRMGQEFRQFEASNRLPLAAVLRRCLFDLEGFTWQENTTEGAFYEALHFAINALGSIQFYIEGSLVVGKFTFYNHYIYFVLDEEDTDLFFERA